MKPDNEIKTETELKKSYDVVIVGAGPAGASAAKTLIGGGLDVLIIEKCPLPRDKVCSGVILPSARKFISDNYDSPISENVFAAPREIKGSRYVWTDEPGYRNETSLDLVDTGDLPEYGFNVYRTEFDFWLCKQSGAPMVDNCVFIEHEGNGGNITARLLHNGEYRKITTRYLIGADGPVSRVRRSLLPEFDKGLEWVSVYEEHYHGEIDLEPGWMYWIIDPGMIGSMASLLHKNGIIHLTVGGNQEQSCKKLFKVFRECLEEKRGLKIQAMVVTRGIVMNTMPYRSNYALGIGNTLLIGEAAGFVRGLDGIASALVTGKAAGESILKSCANGLPAIGYYDVHGEIISEKKICEEAHRRLHDHEYRNV